MLRVAFSVIPIDDEISLAVIRGFLAIRHNTRAWFVRNFHSGILYLLVILQNIGVNLYKLPLKSY
jgi:hypothetical protein